MVMHTWTPLSDRRICTMAVDKMIIIGTFSVGGFEGTCITLAKKKYQQMN